MPGSNKKHAKAFCDKELCSTEELREEMLNVGPAQIRAFAARSRPPEMKNPSRHICREGFIKYASISLFNLFKPTACAEGRFFITNDLNQGKLRN